LRDAALRIRDLRFMTQCIVFDLRDADRRIGNLRHAPHRTDSWWSYPGLAPCRCSPSSTSIRLGRSASISLNCPSNLLHTIQRVIHAHDLA
jgi:hypothetical protein